MLDILLEARSVTRAVHIGLGFGILIVFWLQIFSRKGSPFHILCGRIFYWAGLIIALTALYGVCVVSMNAFIANENASLSDPNAAFLFFLGFLSIITIDGLANAKSAIRFHGPSPGWRKLFPYMRAGISVAVSAALIAYALTYKPSNAILLYIFSPLGFLGAWQTISYQRAGNSYPNRWLAEHIDGMFGAGIAFHTAFMVFGAARFFNPILAETPYQFVPWILPALIGVPAAEIFKRKYKNT